MMYILNYEVDHFYSDGADVSVKTRRRAGYVKPVTICDGHEYILIDTNDSKPHCAWMFATQRRY